MLEIKNVNVTIRHREILKNTSLSLQENSLTVLIGKNGCGKSTLLSCIGGTHPHTGEISINETPITSLSLRERAQRIAILPQHLRAPHMTVASLVSLGRTPHRTLGQRFDTEDEAAVTHALRTTDTDGFADRYLDELSGGERQRAYLAMILAQDAPILLLDEPTTYMDVAVAHSFMALLRTLVRQQKKTVLTVMHDLNCALRYADRVAVMDEGTIVFCGTVAECLATDVIDHTFGVHRFEANGRCFFEGK